MPTTWTTTSWGVVVPVKRLAVAKSRLASFGPVTRTQLALAFAADVVTACLACDGVRIVLVVTDDQVAARELSALGARWAPDLPGAGLNPALRHGVRLLRAELGDCGVIAVSSDLPALRTADLAQVLGAVPRGQRAFVSDASAEGTTVLAAGVGAPLDPAYGAGSRRRHLASGAAELAGTPALRRDVDTPEDLREALLLGVGRHTTRITTPPAS